VDDRAPGSAQRLERALDQMVAALGEHLDRDVFGNHVLLDQRADEVVVGLAGAREADLDLLVAHPHQQLEHPPLALDRHRVDQGLVAVAQIDRAPARRFLDRARRPLPVLQGYGIGRRVRAVPVDRHPAGVLAGNGVYGDCRHIGHGGSNSKVAKANSGD
jgi:hypothetical protein